MHSVVTQPRGGPAIRSPKVVARRSRIYAALLAEGARLFAARGTEPVSVEEIIAAVGISRRTFYGFFANKHALAAALLNPVFDAGVTRLKALARRPPAEVIPGIAAFYLEQWQARGQALQLIGNLEPEVFPYLEAGHRAFGTALKRALRRCETAGLLRNDSAELSFQVLSRTAVPLLKIYRDHPQRDRLYADSLVTLLSRRPADG